ncbi:late competence protein ComER [Lederbergia citrea]|uniref:Late competence protein ComER n=1 Tax=Lederbergia citrea TaxID=2833581 RepID=A0A942UMH4_9BACI|nr:late competence protein ComER [Lederbergia citrea]MBS4176270.1 late competence protein ComER [Lederbergia citrea]MBS4202831.1 late competence protein ComER [Lederbergia citrea]MBS4222502.1 late competence protein ComER [Lederbergia citrea]
MKVGIIGTGNMGTILSEALLDGKAASPSDLIVVNRTRAKAERLKHKFTGIMVANSIQEVIKHSNLIFLCVKPNDIFPLVKDNNALFKAEQCLVSITSPITTDWLENITPCSCARIIPSITNRALSGATLVTFGKKCESHWQKKLIDMFSAISLPMIIDDKITRVASDIVSCGPAFFSYMTRRFIEATVADTNIDEETATKLSEHMLIGLGDLLKKRFYSLPTLEEKVCVKGGITGEGIKVLEKELDGVFEKLLQATHRKFDDEVKHLEKVFNP